MAAFYTSATKVDAESGPIHKEYRAGAHRFCRGGTRKIPPESFRSGRLYDNPQGNKVHAVIVEMLELEIDTLL